jgi:hypothetical protein
MFVFVGHYSCCNLFKPVTMENSQHPRGLNFAQRNWFLLCIIVAIVSSLVTYFIQSGKKIPSDITQGGTISTSAPANDSAGIPPDSLPH